MISDILRNILRDVFILFIIERKQSAIFYDLKSNIRCYVIILNENVLMLFCNVLAFNVL